MPTIMAFALAVAVAQPVAPGAPSEAAPVQAELQALMAELNRARRARDRAALERLYAPEYRWVHGVGYADDRARQIEKTLEANSDRDLPPFDFAPPAELIVHGDVAVLRRPGIASAGGLRLYSTIIFVRRDGRWQFLHQQGTPLLAERHWVELPTISLEALAGRYRNTATGTETVLTRDGTALNARIPNVPRRVLRPVAADRFYDDIGTEYVFERGPDGRVRAFDFRMIGGRGGRSERVD